MRADPNRPVKLTPAVFADRFRECSSALWCIAAAVLGERTHAEDVLQEAAMIGLAKLESFVPHTSFAAWMGQIVRFTALNHRRKLQRRAHSETVGDPPDLDAPAPWPSGFDARTAAALTTLSEIARTCLLLRTVLELEYAEIGELLAIPAGTAMSHVHRARARMRALLEDLEQGDERR